MSIRIRLTGDPDEIAALVHALGQVTDVAFDGRSYPNRSGFGVRVYLEARPHPTTATPCDRRERP